MTLNDNLKQSLQELAIDYDEIIPGRHPSSIHMIKVLAPNPNLPQHLFIISNSCFEMGLDLFQMLPDSPELTAGLRKLLEAKDCFVRAALDAEPVSYTDR